MRLTISFLLIMIIKSVFGQDNLSFDNISLNGEWEIIYDYENIGKVNQFHSNEGFDNGFIEKISVPSVWERFKKDYEGVVYYRTTFKVDKSLEVTPYCLYFLSNHFFSEFVLLLLFIISKSLFLSILILLFSFKIKGKTI